CAHSRAGRSRAAGRRLPSHRAACRLLPPAARRVEARRARRAPRVSPRRAGGPAEKCAYCSRPREIGNEECGLRDARGAWLPAEPVLSCLQACVVMPARYALTVEGWLVALSLLCAIDAGAAPTTGPAPDARTTSGVVAVAGT